MHPVCMPQCVFVLWGCSSFLIFCWWIGRGMRRRGDERGGGREGCHGNHCVSHPWLVLLARASICYFCHYSTPQTRAQSQDTNTQTQDTELEGTLTNTNKDSSVLSFLLQSLTSHVNSVLTQFNAKTHLRGKVISDLSSYSSYELKVLSSNDPPKNCSGRFMVDNLWWTVLGSITVNVFNLPIDLSVTKSNDQCLCSCTSSDE